MKICQGHFAKCLFCRHNKICCKLTHYIQSFEKKMVNSCVVCGVIYRKGVPISFHRLPFHQDLREEWIKALNLVGHILPKYTYVCSQHFSKTCYAKSINTSKTGLRKGAVPRLYPVSTGSLYSNVYEQTVSQESSKIRQPPSTAQSITSSTAGNEENEDDSTSVTITATESESGSVATAGGAKVTYKSSSSTLTASEKIPTLRNRERDGEFTPPPKKRKFVNERYCKRQT